MLVTCSDDEVCSIVAFLCFLGLGSGVRIHVGRLDEMGPGEVDFVLLTAGDGIGE